MLPSEIVDIARLQTNTSTDIVSQVDAYKYMNIVISDFRKDISDNNIGQSLTSWTYTLTANTATYVLPAPTAATSLSNSVFGIQQLVKIGVKYDADDTYYTPVSLFYVENLKDLPDWYAAQQAKAEPLALTDGTNVLIYPTPTTTITNGLQLRGPKLHFPLGTTGSTVITEDVAGCILIPENYHYTIVEGLKYWFYGVRGIEFESIKFSSKNNYESEKSRIINQLLDRMQESGQYFPLDLTYYS